MPSGSDPEPNTSANRDMPWRYQEGRLLSLPGVRKTVWIGEPLPLTRGNSVREVVNRLIARLIATSPPPRRTYAHRSHSLFATV